MTRGRPSILINHLKQILLLIFLMKMLEGKGGSAEDISANCPPQPFMEGEVINVTCEINRTSISNVGCFIPPTYLDFRISLTSAVLALCSPDYPPSSSCAQNLTKGACFCAHQTGDIYTYQYNFIANAGYQGGNITCDICASPLIVLNQRIHRNCINIFIASRTSTTALVTTTKAVRTTPSTSPVTSKASSGILVWWLILIVVLVNGFLSIIFHLLY